MAKSPERVGTMIRNQSGFSLTEAAIASVILMVIAYSIITTSTFLIRAEQITTDRTGENKVLQSIIEGIKADPALYQKNFNTTTPLATLLDESTLPLGYGPGYLGPRGGCGDICFVYFGYVLRPILSNPGLFEVSVRMFNVKTNETEDVFFIVASN